MRPRMKFIRLGRLKAGSIMEILAGLRQRLSGEDDSCEETSALHSDMASLAAYAGGNPRLLECLLAAGSAYKGGTQLHDRRNVASALLLTLLEDGLPEVGAMKSVLESASKIATGRNEETLQWNTDGLQKLLAHLMCDVMTQRRHKRGDVLVVGSQEVSYDALMSKHIQKLDNALPW